MSTQTASVIAAGKVSPKKWGRIEWLFLVWVALALLALFPITSLLEGTFPIFTVILLGVPLAAVLLTRDAARAGFRPVPWREYLRVAAINLGALLLIALAIEPWAGSYQTLVREATSASQLDTTFAWLVRYEGATAWGGMLLYSGLVTIFAEELFFRGWLLQLLQKHMSQVWAVVLQAALFTLLQGIAALMLPQLQGVLYVVAYSFLGVGLVGGWAAARTQSIWPSLTAAVLFNFVLTFLLL